MEAIDHQEEEESVVVVGGGIGGLATALALHRKELKSVVLERSENLRAFGSALTVHANGWRVLDQLGVASKLRSTALPFQLIRDLCFEKLDEQPKPRSFPVKSEVRCIRRSDLITALAEPLPHGTIRFGCQVISIHLDPLSSQPVIQLMDGTVIKSKVLIGCDGTNSVVADFLGLKPSKLFNLWVTRGITFYPNGHGFPMEFSRERGDGFMVGREPIDDKTLHWFVKMRGLHPSDLKNTKDPKLILDYTLNEIKGIKLPAETVEMISNCNLEKLSITHVRYRAPWDLVLPRFRRGTVTVTGDGMHVMGPFLGQGGSAALEDGMVLGRSLARKLSSKGIMDLTTCKAQVVMPIIGEAIDEYVKERRMRVLQLSAQSYLTGCIFQSSSPLIKLFFMFLFGLLFKDRVRHSKFDCGRL